MSKYKVGDKFILEIEEVRENKAPFDNTYIVKGGIGLVEIVFDRMQKVDSNMKIEDITDMIAEYDTEKKGYNRGLQDAWELAQKLWLPACNGGINIKIIEKIFECDYFEIPKHFTAQEALSKIQAYEKEQAEIKVGDVVTDGHNTMLVTGIGGESGLLFLIGSDGEIATRRKPCHWEKTGKHIDIQAVLKQIGE